MSTAHTRTVSLNDFLGLELECFYYYDQAVPADDISPPERAVVELYSTLLNNSVISLTQEQVISLEQHLLELCESEL
jgi:hypothetical protein